LDVPTPPELFPGEVSDVKQRPHLLRLARTFMERRTRTRTLQARDSLSCFYVIPLMQNE
jgi:hypothetical protein